METATKTMITVEATVKAPVEKVWQFWAGPEHIVQWNSPLDDWHTTKSVNDLREGGEFSARMEAKDGSFGFDFGGVHDKVIPHKLIDSTLGDGRKMSVSFSANGSETQVTETFEAEGTNTVEMQRSGWQAILNNFKKYAETH